jgi:hypothetical protein
VEATTIPLIMYFVALHGGHIQMAFCPKPLEIPITRTLEILEVHNLCFRCPNGQCEPILDIYVLIAFQCCKELFKPMGFDPYNCVLKIRESNWDSNPQHGSSIGGVGVHSFTLFGILGSM